MKTTERDKTEHRQLTMWDYLQKDTAERESYAEVCAAPRMAETKTTNTNEQKEGLLEQILTGENLNRAYKQVVRNKGAGGIDSMQVDELLLDRLRRFQLA